MSVYEGPTEPEMPQITGLKSALPLSPVRWSGYKFKIPKVKVTRPHSPKADKVLDLERVKMYLLTLVTWHNLIQKKSHANFRLDRMMEQ